MPHIPPPFFSIIIPTLNEEAFLPRLLQNLSQQTFSRFQTIIVDAQSQDNTLNLARQFQHRLNLNIITSPKKNVSYQRNLGAKNAQAPWLLFFDADNQLPPHFLLNLQSKLSQTRTDIFSTFIVPDSQNPQDRAICLMWNLAAKALTTLKQPTAFGACIGIKKSIFNQTQGFNPQIAYQEDKEFVQRLTQLGYRFTLFEHPQIIYSFRRFRKEGRLNYIRKALILDLQNTLTGFKANQNHHLYPMIGGSYYQSSPPPNQFNQLIKSLSNTQLQKLESFINHLSTPKHLKK